MQFTTEEIIDILTKDEENLSDIKRFLAEYTGKIPYLAYSLAVYPRASVEWMVAPGINYTKLNEMLMNIKGELSNVEAN